MVVLGSLSLQGMHPGWTQDPHQGQSRECVHSDLTAQLPSSPLPVPAHSPGEAWAQLATLTWEGLTQSQCPS